jgi:hypothetical protein
MIYLESVSSEGGPLLLADANVARKWRGVEEGGHDYERACDLFDKNPDLLGGMIAIGKREGLLWELQGAGSAHIFRNNENNFVVVRAWLATPDDANMLLQLAQLEPQELTPLGILNVSTSILAILWATENGECIETLDVDDFERPSGEMSTEEAGLLLKVKGSEYKCYHDTIRIDGNSAIRCHLIAR